jgi:hypothetical protein
MDVLAEAKLFIELEWWAAGLVIAGGVLLGKVAYDILDSLLTSPTRRTRPERVEDQAGGSGAESTAPPGWYDDAIEGQQRYWDGKAWTEQYRLDPDTPKT